MYPTVPQDVHITPSIPAGATGKPLLAISGALIWPGVGHFLVGCYYTGLFWFAAAISLVMGIVNILADGQHVPRLGILVPTGLGVGVLQMLDALRAGQSKGNSIITEPAVRYITAVILIIAGVYWQHRVISYLQNHVYEICYTPTPSMAPNLASGDRFVTIKSLPFDRWDIVGFRCPESLHGIGGENWMKRVVGLPGEQVEVTGKGVLVNGKPIDVPTDAGPFLPVDRSSQPLGEPSPQTAATGCWGRPIILGPDEYFLLGDNTLESLDARFWPSVDGHQPGAMPRDQITCKVVGICWPLARCRMFP